MGKHVNKDKKCDFSGCNLPYLHSGMHKVAELPKRRSFVCPTVLNSLSESTNMTNNLSNEAVFRTSPCQDRNDELITEDSLRLQEVIISLRQIRDIINKLIELD